MWVFTEVADWFDRQRLANNKFLDSVFQDWVDYAVKHEDEQGYWPAIRNGMIYGGSGTLYAVNQLTTTVASGFVDTLRIGDGIKKGGWGYGQDALRLLSVAGAAAKPLNALLKVGRVGLAQVVAVDTSAAGDVCTWVTAAKALVMTGTRHFATLESIATALGWPDARVGAALFLGEFLPILRAAGATVREAGPLSVSVPVDETLAGVLQANPNAIVPFSVHWIMAAGTAIGEFATVAEDTPVGHTMIAFRAVVTGALRIMDRTGKIYGSLAEVEAAGYPGISTATFYENLRDTALIIEHASVVPQLQNGAALAQLIQAGAKLLRAPDGTQVTDPSWLRQGVGVEVRSVPFRTEAKRTITVPLRVARAKGQIKTQTVCVPIFRNSDAPPDAPTQDCSVYRTYLVQQGDTLEAVAQSAYGNPQRWRGIAVVNGIRDPSMLKPGMTLLVP
jgi:hypothetical protein